MLAARSPVFRAMFGHKTTKESATAVVEVKEAQAEAMRMLVNFYHSQQELELDDDLLIQVLVLADRYQIGDLAVSFCFV